MSAADFSCFCTREIGTHLASEGRAVVHDNLRRHFHVAEVERFDDPGRSDVHHLLLRVALLDRVLDCVVRVWAAFYH